MRNNAITIIIIFLTLGCKTKDQTKIIKEITFNVGFNTLPRFTGILKNQNDGTEFIYFADPVSNKTIKVFNLNGQLIKTIPLKKAIKLLNNVGGIFYFSKDTIVIHSNYTNEIITINDKGDCWHKTFIQNQIIDSLSNVYQINSSFNSNSNLQSNALIFNTEFRSNLKDQLNKKEQTEALAYEKYYYSKCFNSAFLVKIANIFTKKPTLEFGLFGFYKNISKVPRYFVEGFSYKSYDNFAYLSSTFSNKLFILNPKTLTIIKEITIKSKFSNLGWDAPLINAETIKNKQETILKNGRTKGFIDNYFYDIKEKKHYLILAHEISESKYKETINKRGYRQFSVLVTDSSFNNQNEYIIDNVIFAAEYSIMTSKGLIIPKKNKSNEKITYSLFKF